MVSSCLTKGYIFILILYDFSQEVFNLDSQDQNTTIRLKVTKD